MSRPADPAGLLWLPFAREVPRAGRLAALLGGEVGALHEHRFPDGEALVRLDSPVRGRDVAFIASLDHPDDKVLPLLFAAATARELGARSVGLVAPYLAYLRQDRRFHPGEAVSARLFASTLARPLDWLVTVEPHLHRVRELGQVYPIPAIAAPAAPALAAWVAAEVDRPLLVGPDEESGPWVEAVARRVGAPWCVGRKVRTGDREVRVELPADLGAPDGRTPVLIDDVISTGRTLVSATQALVARGWAPPVVVAAHGLFTPDARPALAAAGIARLATCDTVPHPDAIIDSAPLLAQAIRAVARPAGGPAAGPASRSGAAAS